MGIVIDSGQDQSWSASNHWKIGATYMIHPFTDMVSRISWGLSSYIRNGGPVSWHGKTTIRCFSQPCLCRRYTRGLVSTGWLYLGLPVITNGHRGDLPLVLADCHLSHINSLTVNDDRITASQPRCSACSSAIKESDKAGPWLCAHTCSGDPIPSCERRMTTQIRIDPDNAQNSNSRRRVAIIFLKILYCVLQHGKYFSFSKNRQLNTFV